MSQTILILLAFAAVVLIAFVYVKVIKQGTNAIVERLGKFSRVLKPGIHVLVPFIESVRIVHDMREQVWDYPPQSVITEDNISTNIDTVIFYYITDPVKATYEIRNLADAILKLSMTAIRNIVGNLTLDELLTSREQVNQKLRVIVDEATDPWGGQSNKG